jgi:MFS family permease
VLSIVLPLLALDLVAAALFVHSQVGLVVCVVAGGLVLGVLNTVLTESVMEATDLPRSVASSSYSAVRFLGGAVAPPLATTLAAAFTESTPYYAAAGCVLVATLIIVFGRKLLARVNTHEETTLEAAEVLAVGDAA